jgi:hypothetical protein
VDRAFVLQHQQPYEDEPKLIGVYSSQEAAEAAIRRLKEQPGFCDYPEWFSIDPYDLDVDHWVEGFEAAKRREIPGWACLSVLMLIGAVGFCAVTGKWISLPFILGYGLFFFAVAALAKRKADSLDFSRR